MNCPHCKDTGDTGSGHLDCFHCDAAMIIAAYRARMAVTECRHCGFEVHMSKDAKVAPLPKEPA